MLFERQISIQSRVAYRYDSLAGLIFGFFSGMVLSFVPVVARRLGASAGQMALISSSFAFGLLLMFLWTYLSILGRKMQFFYWPNMVARSLFFLTPLVYKPGLLVTIVILYNLLGSMVGTAYGAIMKEIYPEDERARTMGYSRVVTNLAALVAAFLGGWLMDMWGPYSFKIVFPIGAALGLISLNTFKRIPLKEEVKDRQPLPMRAMLKNWFSDKGIWKMGGIISVAGFGNLLLGPLAPIFLVDKLKVSLSFVGIMSAASSVAIIVSYYFWGKFIDRKGPMLCLRASFLLISLPPLLYLVGEKWSVLLAAVFSSFAAAGWYLSWFKYVCMRADSSEKVQIDTGIYNNLMGIRGVIAPFVAVWLMKSLGLNTAFFIAFLIVISGFALSWVFEKSLIPQRVIS